MWMAISQNCGFGGGGRWSWNFRKFSKTTKIVNTSPYLPKKPNFIEFRADMTKISHLEVANCSKFSDFQKILEIFRTKKSWNPSQICLKSEKWQKFSFSCSHSNFCAIAIKNQILLLYNKLHGGKFLFFWFLFFFTIFQQKEERWSENEVRKHVFTPEVGFRELPYPSSVYFCWKIMKKSKNQKNKNFPPCSLL